MIKLKLLWTEYPYKAGFTITDDTDAATLQQVKAVYDFLLEKNFRITKTVWAFPPTEPCGIPATPDSTLRGVTLQNEQYLEYIKKLDSNGFEISLHSATAGNNSRQNLLEAFKLNEKLFNKSRTFICHSKNAENIYWEEKTTNLFPFRQLLAFLSKNKNYGEVESSKYFWGDICKEKIDYIRLLRVRDTNTLKQNPSMPYHDKNKPYVNYWFSATKRRIADCATPNALNKLISQNGLTILYQYLHRYADPDTLKLNDDFVNAINAISSNKEIQVAPVQQLLHRLKALKHITVKKSSKGYCITNESNISLNNLQFEVSGAPNLEISDVNSFIDNNVLVIPVLASKESITICSPERLNFANLKHTHREKQKLPILEEYNLLISQVWIVVREILFKGRSLNSQKYLDANKTIKLENHDNW